jgi:hypothetical protein
VVHLLDLANRLRDQVGKLFVVLRLVAGTTVAASRPASTSRDTKAASARREKRRL